MNIHEYQAREILESYGVSVPRAGVASTPDEARQLAVEFGGRVAVKAQVHAGGRGKAGGVKLVQAPDEAAEAAAGMLGTNLVTHQTKAGGAPVRKVLVAELTDIADELYVAITMDADAKAAMVMASSEGGVEIEEVAANTPNKIVRHAVDPLIGLSPYHARDIAMKIGVPTDLVRPATGLITNLCRVFQELDASLVEINPLVVTTDGRVMALDAKIAFEDDALFRHREILDLEDSEQNDELEQKAHDAGLAYVKLDGGRVGCMVNGAGLAMATMDITKTAGAAPANFLDVGGGAAEDKIAEAFEIIVSDDDVEVILVNLFGGILRCDVAARGIVMGAQYTGTQMPLVVAMRGTNANEGLQILADAGLNVTTVGDLGEAATALTQVLGADGSNA
ncbi:MAG: ADP-forming succinate--CoA ligase subunit beta [Dehalococcoidia bacterium]|jgi:succinyl-CoA synthetase beta subunit|nr:ADP-forming succinate--CoA ligase subunit beta [Dehalococcoidia bacterium]